LPLPVHAGVLVQVNVPAKGTTHLEPAARQPRAERPACIPLPGRRRSARGPSTSTVCHWRPARHSTARQSTCRRQPREYSPTPSLRWRTESKDSHGVSPFFS
jgi:hypothetical protein